MKPLLSLNLLEFPEKIANHRRQLLAASQNVRALQEALVTKTAKIDHLVAHDETLTNDTKRKARRAELMDDADYKALLSDLQIATDKRTEIEINLSLLLDQFSVLKLEKREGIARLEVQAA